MCRLLSHTHPPAVPCLCPSSAQVALEMLRSGAVDAVVCVQSDPTDRFAPRPFVARCEADVLAARGVKPVLSPSLEVLATVEALPDVKRLLFIGVGCQVQSSMRKRAYPVHAILLTH
eukprot:365281-Chlamydomonas_euryale.AAC.5